MKSQVSFRPKLSHKRSTAWAQRSTLGKHFEKCLNLVSLLTNEDDLGWLVSEWKQMSWNHPFQVSPASEIKGEDPENQWAWFLKVRMNKISRRAGRTTLTTPMLEPVHGATSNQRSYRHFKKVIVLQSTYVHIPNKFQPNSRLYGVWGHF